LLKQRWDCVYETFQDVVETTEDDTPAIQVGADGSEQLIPRKKQVEKEVKVTKKVFEGPVLGAVDAEDLTIIGGEGDPQRADSVHHRTSLLASELWTLVDRQIFNEENTKKVLDHGQSLKIGPQGSDIKLQRANDAGQSQVDTEADLDRYEIIESYLSYDVDGSGIASKIIVWWHRPTRAILRATYLRRVNKSGEVPFYKIDFHRRPGQTYGVGIVEMMYPISKELDAIHNIRIDSGMIANMPVGFYKASSSLNPETIDYEPGSLIPLDNPTTDIYFPQMGNKTAFGAQEEQALQTLIERLTGINDLSLGVLSGTQGATRTASGVRALLGESNANLDVFLRRLNRGWTQALRGLLHMLQQRIPAGLAFRVTGEGGDDYWRQIRSAEDLEGDYDIELSANTANSNKAIQQEVSNQILQATANPLDYQLGVVTPAQRYEAYKNWYKQLGVKDFARYIQAPPNYQYLPTPQEEIQRIIRGMPVPVQPNSDHQGFLDAFEHIMESDDLLGRINEQQTHALAAQAAKHVQMMQAMQAQQAQVANVQQQSINADAGASAAANPAANPMSAGGAAQGIGPAQQPGQLPT
jgi:hypothetical protein